MARKLKSDRVLFTATVLLVIDVDHLKRVNDTAGQQAGDEVLTRLGESIVSRVFGVEDRFDQLLVLAVLNVVIWIVESITDFVFTRTS